MKTRNKNLVTNPTGKYQTKLNLLEVSRNFKGMNVMENFSMARFVAIRTLYPIYIQIIFIIHRITFCSFQINCIDELVTTLSYYLPLLDI